MSEAKQDQNYNKTLLAVSNADNSTPVNVWVDPSTHRLLADVSISSATVSGGKTNNGAAPSTDNIGALTGVATAAAPSYTEGRLVALSTDLAGNLRVTGSLSVGGTTDNSAFTAGTSTGTPSMGFYHSTIDTVTDGRAAAIAITSKRAQHASLYTPNGDSAMDDTNDALKVVNATAANLNATVVGTGTFAVQAAQSGTWNVGTVTTVTSVTQNADVRQSTASNLNAQVVGEVAHDAADSGNPLKIGGKALTAQPTAVAGNDRVNAMFDIYGRLIVMNSLREMKGNQITTITSSTSETTVVTADATYKLDVYAVFVTNTSATATEVSFKDSTAGTTRFTLSVPANDMRGFCLPVDAGHLQGSANNNWTATCADSVASIIITVLFVKNL